MKKDEPKHGQYVVINNGFHEGRKGYLFGKAGSSYGVSLSFGDLRWFESYDLTPYNPWWRFWRSDV